MHKITFKLSNLHTHGTAFYDFLALRKHFFVDVLGWDVPHDEDVEMDQYDNPRAHYALVLDGDKVLGGARVMPTSSIWGEHTYMLGDAFAGKLRDIPQGAMPSEISSPSVWECTRLVMSEEVATQQDRAACLSLILDGVVEIAAREGANQVISLSPISMQRALRQLGFDVDRLGEPYHSAEDGRKYAVLSMPTGSAHYAMAAE